MADELLDYMTDLINSTEWPEAPFINAKSQHAYETGMDILNLYRGHPQILLDALRAFYQTGSKPYAYAGIAAVLQSAAFSHSDVYEQAGLVESQRWLERAQAIVADRVEINFLEALLYINLKEYSNARLLLDHFERENYQHFSICTTEMKYWDRQNDVKQVFAWFQQAMRLGATKARQSYSLSRLAGCYLNNRCYQHAIHAYQQLAQLDPEDPWLWHNRSIAHFRLKQYKDAEKCNKKALGLMDFQAARDMERAIKQKRPAGWF